LPYLNVLGGCLKKGFEIPDSNTLKFTPPDILCIIEIPTNIGGLMPKTRSGKWPIWLIPIMIVLFFLGNSFTNTLYDTIQAGSTILEDIAKRPALAF